jgi:uroporphyrinogen III methyltransferase/synthase
MRSLGGVRLAAIGAPTAEELAQFHLRADLVPPAFRSESLVESLAGEVCGARVLLARADRGRDLLKRELEKLAHVDQVAVYHQRDVASLPGPVVDRIERGAVDWITLTSSAITTRLHALLSESARKQVGNSVRLASISPLTTETAARYGWAVAAEATEFTWEGLVRAVVGNVMRDRVAGQHDPTTNETTRRSTPAE